MSSYIEYIQKTSEIDHVDLVIYPGEAIHPDKITDVLHITPTDTTIPGRVRPANKLGRQRTDRIFGWFLSSKDSISSYSLYEHMEWLLSRLFPARNRLREIQKLKQVEMFVSCMLWPGRQGGGLFISPEHIAQLSRLNLACEFSVYMWEAAKKRHNV